MRSSADRRVDRGCHHGGHGATTPVVAPHATTAVAAGLDFFFLAVSFAQLEDSLADLTPCPNHRRGGWCGSTALRGPVPVPTAGFAGCPSWRHPRRQAWLLAWVPQAFGHHDGLLGRRHHRANGLGFRQGFAATLFQIAGTRRFFERALALSGCLFAGFILGCGTGSRFGLLLACSFLLLRRGLRLLAASGQHRRRRALQLRVHGARALHAQHVW